MDTELQGKIALVTGGASGIGKAASLAFAREGAKVIVADINSEGGEATAHQIEQNGGKAAFVKADVSRVADVEALINQCVGIYGRLDCAFNNAGIAGARAAFADFPEDSWDEIIRVNLKSVWLCMKHEIRQMLVQGGGAIVNIASTGALAGSPNSCAYCASSHGILGLTKTAALECAKSGVRVNAVCPGVIRTPMIERMIARAPEGERPKAEAQMASRSPMGRMGAPEEVAAAVIWLCSPAAGFVTGAALPLDGGFVAG
ncbi:MAG: SDR family oxidoreductase [Candidatus Sumerlaeota bacterium]|nr:SDR family oxidoreductase [Candidatus Sumerlaeota bacterium]